VGDKAADDQGYRITFDGQVTDIRGFQVLGGAADAVSQVLESSYQENAALETVLNAAVDALGRDGTEPRTLAPSQLEVAVLERTRTQARKFRRFSESALARLLGVDADGAADGENGGGKDSGKDSGDSGQTGAGNPPAAKSIPADDGDVLGAVDDILGEDEDSPES